MDAVGTGADGNAVVTILDVVVLDENVGSTRSKPISVEWERLTKVTVNTYPNYNKMLLTLVLETA